MEFAHFEFSPETDRLGEGPLSEVYRATDQTLGRTVALKILRAHAEIDPAADQRFHREAKHASNLQHPNIATIYEYGKDEKTDTAYIAMEYLEGRTLDQILKDQALGFEECFRVAGQLTAALENVHRAGLIHRDLKPANIMVLDDGKVKLLDFGIARASNESSITQHGTLVGTVLYMSPEQVRGDELKFTSDIFSLGSVLYHMATGQLPFPGKSFPEVCMAILDGKPKRPSEVRSGFPPAFETVLLRCLSPEPENRYRHAEEIHGAILGLSPRRPAGINASKRIEGKLMFLPTVCSDASTETCRNLAGSLRNDLAQALNKIPGLSVQLATFDDPRGDAVDFILSSTIQLNANEASLELSIESRLLDGTSGFQHHPVDLVTHSDEDEWALQDDLVRTASRIIRKRLTEIAASAPIAAVRNEALALELTHQAHDVLSKGTSRQLMAAMSTFRRATDADPFCALAYAGMAEALVRKFLYFQGDEDYLAEAREMADKALTLDSSCAEAHTSLGFAYHISGHLNEAAREYRIAIQYDTDEWFAHRLLGTIFSREGNFKKSAGFLRRAINLKTTHVPSYDHLYGVLQRLDRYEESLEVADEGIAAARAHLKLHGDDQEARVYLALLLARLRSDNEARKHVQLALDKAPKDGYTAFQAACVYAATGDFTEAIEQLTRARDRGYYIELELRNNTDLDVLRGLPEFRELQN
jgi:serine/threonine protein kinase/Tfp pilus assembly protein PilF